MTKLIIIFCLLFYTLAVSYSYYIDSLESSEVILNLLNGRIKGSVLKTRSNENFYGFRGIRYGQAPIGQLRYKAPIPVEPWTGIFDGTSDGPMCPQPKQPSTAYSEDCLRLNVYTKSINPTELKPVIVYIPGGGFYMGSGVRSHYGGPQYLMEHDIVFVAINYRLGTLGFLATNTTEYPGNAALKDQVLALRWVQENINHFGGDPKSVTLWGNSAGALSIAFHLVSPMSEGLFDRVVMMSGVINPKKKLLHEQIAVAKKQASILNCRTNTLDETLGCLQQASVSDIVDRTADMSESGYGWNAVIEYDFGQERFLTEDPYEAIRSGNFKKVPVIIGITKDDFTYAAFGIIKNLRMLQNLDSHFYTVAPAYFRFEENSQRSREICDTLWNLYNLTHPLNENQIVNIHHLVSDSIVGFATHRFSDIVSEHSNVYSYLFSYQGQYSHYYLEDGKPYGVEHSDDLLYLLVRPVYAPMIEKNDPDDFMIDRMTKILTNFAKTGNPNITEWKKFNKNERPYLDIGRDLIQKENLFTERYTTWDNLFPLD